MPWSPGSGWWTLLALPGRYALLSPVLQNGPWERSRLHAAIEIIRQHGGRTAPGTHSFIRVEMGNGGRELVRTMFSQFVKELDQLASDPVTSWGHAPWTGQPVFGPGYVAFPPWTGSLDNGVLQTRIGIWSALVTPRGLTGQPGWRPWPAAEPLGTHGANPRRVLPEAGELTPDKPWVFTPGPASMTVGPRGLFGAIFDEPGDQEMAAALWHITPRRGGRLVKSAAFEAIGGAYAVPVAGQHSAGAVFADPTTQVPAWLVAATGAQKYFAEPTFTAVVDLAADSGSVLVHGPGGNTAADAGAFAELLRELGWVRGTTVHLSPFERPWPVTPALLEGVRRLGDVLAAPVTVVLDGSALAQVAETELRGFTLFALPGSDQLPGQPAGGLAQPPALIVARYDPRPGVPVAPATLTPLPALPGELEDKAAGADAGASLPHDEVLPEDLVGLASAPAPAVAGCGC